MTLTEIIERECPCNCPDENRFAGGHAAFCRAWHRETALAVARAVVGEFVAYEDSAKATYLGGYDDPRDIKIFHHGIATVFNMLRSLAAQGPGGGNE